MRERQQQIIQRLLMSTDLQTSQDLAFLLQVSSKTVRTDIKAINERLNDKTAHIESYRGKGYRLNIKNNEAFKSFLQENTAETSHIVPTEPEDRVQFLLEVLLLQSDYVKMENIADKLFISRSTLQNDLNVVRELLGHYNLYIEHKPNYGIKVHGDEMQIRFCISEYIFNRKSNMVEPATDWLEILPKGEIEWIRDSILSKLRKHNIIITDISLHNLITHIAISCKRLRIENTVEIHQEEQKRIIKRKEYTVAEEIVEELETKLQVTFPENEIAYLAIHLQGTKMSHSESDMEEFKSVLDDDVQALTSDIIERIDNVYSTNLSEDQELGVVLSLHLKPALNRYEYNMNLRNPMLDEIKTKYPLSFEAAFTGAEVIRKRLGMSVDEDEIGFMALHIGAALERQKNDRTDGRRCLIVCASGLGTAQLLLYKLNDYFGEQLNIVGTTEYYNLNKNALQNVDFIISTIPITEQMPVPVIQISTLLGNQDVAKIRSLINNEINIIKTYMREQFTYLKMNFSTKEEVIHFVGKKLLEAGMVNTDFVASVIKREGYSPTSFGNLVAIPHPLEPQTDETFWSIVTLKHPIQWGDKHVQFICLLNFNKQKMDDLKPMYDVLVKLLDDQALLKKLLECETYTEFTSVLTSI